MSASTPRYVDASASLDAFYDHSGHVSAFEDLLNTFGVVQVAEGDFMNGIEGRDYFGIVRNRHSSGGAPVKAAVKSNHTVLSCMEGRQLEGVLV